jgi:glycosyltransferase involved in cell wall biosynthesis
MTHIVMLLSNPYRPDPRVSKEAESLIKLGYAVSIVCWDRQREMPLKATVGSGIKVLRIHNVSSNYGIGLGQVLRLPFFWTSLWRYLSRLQPDIIHCHDFDTLIPGLLWGKLHRKPVIYDAHEYFADLCKPRLPGRFGYIIYRTIHILEHWGARLASGIITVDRILKEIYLQDNTNVIILGHYPSLTFISERNPVFSKPLLNLIYAGRLSIDRGLLIYLEILHHLKISGIPTRLFLAGVFTPSSDENLFYSRIKDLEEDIKILGWVPYENMPAVLRTKDVGLMIFKPEPRYINAVPVKLFENMASGLPVVASNFPQIVTIIQKENCGLLVDPLSSPKIAADGIANWWKNPEIARKLGDNGKKAISRSYFWESQNEKIDSFYKKLI